jgi:hypothetical protein
MPRTIPVHLDLQRGGAAQRQRRPQQAGAGLLAQ